jgi:hypothetical protein
MVLGQGAGRGGGALTSKEVHPFSANVWVESRAEEKMQQSPSSHTHVSDMLCPPLPSKGWGQRTAKKMATLIRMKPCNMTTKDIVMPPPKKIRWELLCLECRLALD